MSLSQMHDSGLSSLQLPSDFLKTPSTSFQSGEYHFYLDLSELPLLALTSQRDVATPSTLLATFSALLYRYSLQEKIGVRLITLDDASEIRRDAMLWAGISGDLTAQELISHIAIALNGRLESEVSDQSPVTLKPTLEQPSPVSVTFVSPSSIWNLEGLLLAERYSELADHSDLHLFLIQEGEALSCNLVYNRNLFKPSTIERIAGHFNVVLRHILQDPGSTIAQLSILTEAEKDQLLTEWKSESCPYPSLPIHHYIEAHAEQRRDEVAITFREKKLTYDQLNQDTNRLANYLMQAGVTAESRVAVCLEPCLEIAVSLLGIFKAGGVYTPIEPTYPYDRLALILEDTEPQIIITQSHLVSRLPKTSATVFCIDTDWPTIAHLSSENPITAIEPDQTAYLVYTSGTTGQPKGVMASHRNLVNYILVARDRYGFDAQDIMPAVARFTFSISLFELLSPLVAGGQLVILERDHVLDFKRMVQTLRGVTIVHTSPSLMRKLLTYMREQDLPADAFRHLKHASMGGDLVPADLLETMKQIFSQAEIYVIYGCSEISCMGCTYPVLRDDTVTKSYVGKPFNNVEVRLYDPFQNLVPIGVIGEIYFSGAGVTKGYLNRPELTQEKFVMVEGQRFYRTGDMGRFDEEGNLEILGRSDFQIKLRGIRIELGEIEFALRQTPGVRDGVVATYEPEVGEKRLVGYVVLNPDQTPSIAEIRHHLQQKLPEYMVPVEFVVLDALPVNINQKVDRRALPAPPVVKPDVEAYLAPRNALEDLVSNTWASVLNLERVSIHDNFFILGGHSLVAAQASYHLQAALDLEIPVSKVFEYPTIAAFAEYLSCSRDVSTHPMLPPLTRLERHPNLPLSLAQGRLWFLSQLDAGIAYNIPLALKFSGPLHIPALQSSLTEVLNRHEVLRTTFSVLNGTPMQQIHAPQSLPLSVINLQPLAESEQTEAVCQLAKREFQTAFNLAQELPIRASLLQLSHETHVLLITIHHLVADGWSLAVFQRELALLYTACMQGQSANLEALPMQYVDVAEWQQRSLQSDLVAQQLIYWKQQLSGAPPLLELPYDHPRPSVQTYRGGTEYLTLDHTLTSQLKAISQGAGATLFMTLLTAFAILLSRYSRQQDLVIGSPIANRNRRECEPLIGCFINLLSLRLDVSGNPTFLELLQRSRQVALEAYKHQDAPFERVLESLQLERSASYSPLFQVMFILQNAPIESSNFSGLTVDRLHLESGTSAYDLTLRIEETEEGLIAEFDYNRDLFERATIVRLVAHFQTLLQAIIANPAQPIQSISVLTAAERHQLLVEWNNTQREYPHKQCIHHLFEAQVERTPEAIAVAFQDQQLTYRELNQRANQLAHYLQSLGVGPDNLVGICIERCLEMLVGLLGVLKAGASYVPLDPAYPSERLAYMVETARLSVLVTQQALQGQFTNQPVQIVNLDTDWDAIGLQKRDNPCSEVTSENLAYTIFTSGSTGKPKGVQICHRSVVNFLTSMAQEPGLTERDRLLAVTTISFDIAVLELYLPLSVGAQIILASREAASDANQLSNLIEKAGATVMQATPATWQMLLATGWAGSSQLKILCGGEAMSRELADQLLKRGSCLWNLYGPTETTVWSAVCQVKPGEGAIPVAGPIANTQLYVLETVALEESGSVSLAPIGIPGEVYIGGEGLAQGYLNQPELTQERFIDDPFCDQSGARLYKTGDLARFRRDGVLEFLGRIDHQVKLRGFRIELGEVETLLLQHPVVQQCVVVVQQDKLGDQRLVAYVVADPGEVMYPQSLRQYLQQTLPHYMIPSVFVELQKLPLTPNGKVDRRALPQPSAVDRADLAEYVAPRTSLENKLTQIWMQVLNLEQVGVTDNFFELGGHSLLVAQLFNHLECEFHCSLPMTTIFKAPTIEQLATQLEASLQVPISQIAEIPALLRFKDGISYPPLFLVLAFEFDAEIYLNIANHYHDSRSVYGLQLRDSNNASILFTRIPEMAAYLIQQMQVIQPEGPYLIGGQCAGGVIAFEMALQLQAQGQQVALLALIDAPDSQAQRKLTWTLGKPFYYLMQKRRIQQAQMRDSGISDLLPGSSLLEQTVSTGLPDKKVRWLSRLVAQALLKVKAVVKVRLLHYCLERGLTLPKVARSLLPSDLWEFANRRYHPKEIFNGRTILLRSTEGDGRLKDEPFVKIYRDPLLGWGKRVSRPIKVHDVPGGHASMLVDPNAAESARVLQQTVQEVLLAQENAVD